MRQRIVITDANILIDLIKLDLAARLLEATLFEFTTTDFVYEELYEAQKEILSTVIETGQLLILGSDEDDLTRIFELKQKSDALSIQDCSVWHFASKLEGMLLTGDKQLRKHSTSSGIEVHGILYIFDKMVSTNLIAKKEAVEKLMLLYDMNKWLPQKEVEKRLKEWKDK